MFKQCPLCKQQWNSRDDFLNDSSLAVHGYQVNFNHLKEGLFLFNHSCGTTLAIPAGEFADLYNGPMFTEHREFTDSCPNYCLSESDLRPCPAACECAYVRDVIDLISKKERAAANKSSSAA